MTRPMKTGEEKFANQWLWNKHNPVIMKVLATKIKVSFLSYQYFGIPKAIEKIQSHTD